MWTLIGIFIFAFAEFLFDYSGMGKSTNWSIFYFACTYLSITIISTDLIFKESSKVLRITAGSFAVFFITLMLIELSFINVPFDKYLIEVNESKSRVVTYGLFSIVLIFISLMAWGKRRLKK